jgi:hypothetical protein
MSIVKTHKQAPHSYVAAEIKRAKGHIVSGPVFDGSPPGNIDPHAQARAAGQAKSQAVLDLLSSLEQRVGISAAPGDIWARLKALDATVTARESAGPATQGGLGTSGAAVSHKNLPEAEKPAPHGRSPITGNRLGWSKVDPDADEQTRNAQQEASDREQATLRLQGQTSDSASALERAKKLLARGVLTTPDPRIVAAEAARIVSRDQELAANRAALHLKVRK